MDYLRGVGAVLAETPRVTGTPVEELLGRYGRYLAEERGLATTTISHYDQAARQLLLQRPMTGDQVELTGLSLAEVTAFVARETQRLSSGSARNLVSALRALLRYLHLEGLITQPLASGLPSAACWSGSTLPRALPPGQAARLLDSCDRRRAVGRRDYAILTLLVRLGLRAGEDRQVAVRFADDHRREDLRGRGGQASVKLIEVKEKTLPPLDDDFAKSVGEFETLAALREEVLKQLAARREHDEQRALQEKVVDALVAKHEFTVPEALVMRQIAHRVEHARESMRRQGIDPEQLPWDYQKLIAELRPGAETAVRRALLIEAIADREAIAPSESEVDAEVERLAQASQRPTPAVRRMMEKSGDLEGLRQGLRDRMTLELLVANAKVKA